MTVRVLQQYIVEAEKAFQKHEWIEGRDLLHEALEIEPVYGKAHNHLGWLYLYNMIDFSLAEMHLKLALKYAPDYHATYIHMAQLLFDMGKLDELEVLLNQALTVAGVQKPFVYDQLGRLYEVRENYGKARAYYEMAARWSFDEKEIEDFHNNIKRCRKKKWMSFW